MQRAGLICATILFGLLSSPAAAQQTPDEQTGPGMHRSMYGMHHRVTHSMMRTMRWCHSMSYRQMMRHSQCRALMRYHHHRMMRHEMMRRPG